MRARGLQKEKSTVRETSMCVGSSNKMTSHEASDQEEMTGDPGVDGQGELCRGVGFHPKDAKEP